MRSQEQGRSTINTAAVLFPFSFSFFFSSAVPCLVGKQIGRFCHGFGHPLPSPIVELRVRFQSAKAAVHRDQALIPLQPPGCPWQGTWRREAPSSRSRWLDPPPWRAAPQMERATGGSARHPSLPRRTYPFYLACCTRVMRDVASHPSCSNRPWII